MLRDQILTHGLPRVEELFEARKPKGLATISEIAGQVSLSDNKKKQEVTVTSEDGVAEVYAIPFGSRLKVKEGDVIEAGDELTEGSINPNDILKIKGCQRRTGVPVEGSSDGLPSSGR